jgi:hypothetical protein
MVRRSLDHVGMQRGCRVKFVRVADELVVVNIANNSGAKVRSINGMSRICPDRNRRNDGNGLMNSHSSVA